MGVLGFTPFLLKNCPNVVKTLPDRLKSLSGKTLVIDATLFTQRLWFAPVFHPNRHVLGWFRLVRDLQSAGVSPICVFDGKERNIAKSREVQRRREALQLAAAREQLEGERLKRLNAVSDVLREMHTLQQSEGKPRKVFTQTFPYSNMQAGVALLNLRENNLVLGPSLSSVTDDDIDDNPALLHALEDSMIRLSDMCEANGYSFEDVLSKRQSITRRHLSKIEIPRLDKSPRIYAAFEKPAHSHFTSREIQELFEEVGLDDGVVNVGDEAHPPPEPTSVPESDIKPDTVSEALTSLYNEYLNSIPRLASLPSASTSTAPAGVATNVPDVETQENELIMSKTQVQLAEEEGKFWADLIGGLVPDPVTTGAEASSGTESGAVNKDLDSIFASSERTKKLEKLVERSKMMSMSYGRTANPPSAAHYAESKELLTAMGVPCIDSSGAVEAEALAASLVLNGHADYVASEDTDVLVYEAPLLRNLSNKGLPLLAIDGSDVRTQLELSRDAFVDFALLLGTDFTPRIKNVGPARALRFIRVHENIEGVVSAEGQKYPPRVSQEDYLEQVRVARGVFASLPDVPKDFAKSVQEASARKDEEEVILIMRRAGLGREVMAATDYEQSLAGNYFNDDPTAP